ncbi:PglL family O-oligosaccharyltransferase [Enterobacter soli]|uniref:PglL family O-oligosaccharyltransferase n=1 Tax=Enterobacter soli TaxID=885040 RepID=UPI0034CEB2A3
MRSRTTQDAACWVILLLAGIFLGLMHLALPNVGGSGADLPQALLVWCALLVLIAGCAWILCHQRLQFTLCARLLTLAAVLLTLPLCWSPSPDWRLDALPRLGGLWAGLCLYVLFINCRFTPRQKQVLLWLIAAAALIQTIWYLAGLWWPELLPEVAQEALRLEPETGIGVFQQRNVTASFIATGAAALLWLLADARFRLECESRERARRWAVSAAIAVMYMALTTIASRTGWLGGLAIWLWFTAVFWRDENALVASRRAIALAPPLGIAIGTALLSNGLFGALQEHDGSNVDRILILQQTWKMIVQHPLKGWGYGGFPWSFAHFLADRPVPLSRGMNLLTHPHNELLFWWVEGGAVALAGALLALVAGGIRLLYRPQRYSLAVLGCLLPVLLHTQLEYPLYQSPVHWLLVMLLLSFADAPAADPSLSRSVFKKNGPRLLPCLMATTACCGALLVGVTFWQGLTLTDFQGSPQRYASRVLRLRETGIGTERLRKDRALSYIVRYQKSGNVEDLQRFSLLADRWLATWSDADIYNNLINVERYLGNEKHAIQLAEEAHRLYPEDARFAP